MQNVCHRIQRFTWRIFDNPRFTPAMQADTSPCGQGRMRHRSFHWLRVWTSLFIFALPVSLRIQPLLHPGVGSDSRELCAEANSGVYPHGEVTPEASLSLLSRRELSFAENPHSAVELLRGKTVPAEAVRAKLAAGQLLDPDTCGWHYVEGLTRRDNPELAIVWDKVGLGHNGERLGGALHEVLFVGRTLAVYYDRPVAGVRCRAKPSSLKTRSAAAKTARPDLTAKIKLPDGKLVGHFDEAWTLSMNSVDGDESHRHSGLAVTPASLRWYDLHSSRNDSRRELIFRLSLGKMRSQPVEVRVGPDGATPDAIIFEMTESN